MSDIKDYPTPGFRYRVQKEPKGLSGISRKAYGDGTKWRVIWKANKSNARSSDPNRSFWPGDIIVIPGEAPIEDVKDQLREDVLPTLEDRGENDFTLIINNNEIPVKAGRVLTSIDTAADGWTASVVWDPNNLERAELFMPYTYQDAAVYLGGKLAVRGYLYVVNPTYNVRERILGLEGWSFTADAIDSTIKPPYESKNVTLEKRARDLLEPLGIEVVFNIEDDEKFKRVTANKNDTIFAHLSDLAKQRSALFTSTSQGKALFTKASSGGSVGTIVEDFPPYQEATVRFDGRERFNVYKAVGQSPKKNSKWAVANDDSVPKSRFKTFTADDATQEQLEKAANWERSKSLADALTIRFPVNSWYAPNGEQWEINTIVTVVSPSIFVPYGYDFLIKDVEYIFEPSGVTAILGLVPPQVYTGEELIEPWV